MIIYSARHARHIVSLNMKAIHKNVTNYVANLNPSGDEYKAYEEIMNAVADMSLRAISQVEINSKIMKALDGDTRASIISNIQKLGYEIEIVEFSETCDMNISWRNPTQ